MSPTISFAAEAKSTPNSNTIYTRPTKKPKMSITQTYFLAHSARGKLSKEASRPDHDLRLLVGHANMLDSLMLDIANAEQEQERWFTNSVAITTAEVDEEESPEDLAMEDPEMDWEVEDAETTDSEDEDEDSEGLTLVRTKSRHSPPELTADSESDSEDEHMPSSPPDEPLPLLNAKGQVTVTTTAADVTLSQTQSESFEEDGFFIPTRSRPTIIAAY